MHRRPESRVSEAILRAAVPRSPLAPVTRGVQNVDAQPSSEARAVCHGDNRSARVLMAGDELSENVGDLRTSISTLISHENKKSTCGRRAHIGRRYSPPCRIIVVGGIICN